jgi:hypothetical protein
MVQWKRFGAIDWDNFSGAVAFADGSDPLIAEVTVQHGEGDEADSDVFYAVADFSGVALISADADLVFTSPKSHTALPLAPSMTEAEVVALGFEKGEWR